ncbi:hypothetical protein F5050DRAFT_1787079 [Lentinula boryana]|uniref:Secreted protein n=1 Tax=Lentinula boryana TaxID=40481 RepID=A0ABQ8Q2H4_9AGAR|nr:hypothetical protein F5050DRAFT_1787079 [Lentinula boryana]
MKRCFTCRILVQYWARYLLGSLILVESTCNYCSLQRTRNYQHILRRRRLSAYFGEYCCSSWRSSTGMEIS